jgi:hypothetical protein
MNDPLPFLAETYLRQLAKELWPLSPEEREMILLELRDHLNGRTRQNALAEALAGLGEPHDLARAFVDAGAGDTYRQVGMPGRSLVPVEPPPSFEIARPLTTREIIAAVKATLAGSRDGLFLVSAVLVTILTGPNWGLWVDELRPNAELAAWPLMAVRVIVLILSLAAAYRIVLTDEERSWEVDLSTFRFGGALLALLALTVGGAGLAIVVTTRLASLAGVSEPVAFAIRVITMFVALAFFSCAAFRLQPWAAALATGRRDLTLKRAWRGTSGRIPEIVRGWAILVLPPYLLHFALTVLALKVIPFGPFHLLIAAADAVASMAVALAVVLLNSTVFRWVVGEPTPGLRPFSSEPPSAEMVEQARLRLHRLIGASPGRTLVR